MKLRTAACLLIAGTLLTHLTACGLILYPDRKGQTSGRIDPGVAVLDGLGLLLYLVPGVIAFAVDFSMGTIYLPGGRRAELELPQGPLKPEAMDAARRAAIEAALQRELGLNIPIEGLPTESLDSIQALETRALWLKTSS